MALTTLPSLPAGHAPSAAEFASLLTAITELRPVEAYKTLDQSVTSSTTLADDGELFVSVAASCRYEVYARVKYTAATAGDLKLGWSGPSGATLIWNMGGPASGVTDATGSPYWGANTLAGTDIVGGTGTDLICQPSGILVTSTTAGTLRLRFAQGTSSATATTIYAGSSLVLRRLS